MLYDRFGRKVDYIRLSVTQKCNFRCQYCMPDTPEDFFDSLDDIALDDLLHFVKVAIDEGIKKIRITGGEPLLRKELPHFIAQIYDYNSSIDLALTTNGYFLSHFASALKQAGLKRVNISLDSLKPERIMIISKKNVLQQILSGIDEALHVGLKVKLNMVPLKGVNDDEVVDILRFAQNKGVMLRYIEFMENKHANTRIQGLKEAEILDRLRKAFKFTQSTQDCFGPATLYDLEGGERFGIIAPHNDHFCQSCNRLRLNAEGYIVPCLYFEEAVNIKQAMQQGDLQAIKAGIYQALINKPESNKWGCEGENEISARAFYQTGG